LESAFRYGSKVWVKESRSLDTLATCGFGAMNLSALGSVLLELGWLGTLAGNAVTSRSIALGDIGYMAREHPSKLRSGGHTPPSYHFVVISNLHNLLTSIDGNALSWTSRHSGYMGQTIVIIEHRGKLYRRKRYVCWVICPARLMTGKLQTGRSRQPALGLGYTPRLHKS